jgi:hypothetical protein
MIIFRILTDQSLDEMHVLIHTNPFDGNCMVSAVCGKMKVATSCYEFETEHPH